MTAGEKRTISPERRPNEEDVHYRGRMRTLEGWNKFVEQAKPTEEQQQAILTAMRDGQLQVAEHRSAHVSDLVEEATTKTDAAGTITGNWREVLEGDILAVAEKVLTHDQMAVFMRTVYGHIVTSARSKAID